MAAACVSARIHQLFQSLRGILGAHSAGPWGDLSDGLELHVGNLAAVICSLLPRPFTGRQLRQDILDVGHVANCLAAWFSGGVGCDYVGRNAGELFISVSAAAFDSIADSPVCRLQLRGKHRVHGMPGVEMACRGVSRCAKASERGPGWRAHFVSSAAVPEWSRNTAARESRAAVSCLAFRRLLPAVLRFPVDDRICHRCSARNGRAPDRSAEFAVHAREARCDCFAGGAKRGSVCRAGSTGDDSRAELCDYRAVCWAPGSGPFFC